MQQINKREVFVYSNSRSIRNNFLSSIQKDGFLPKSITINEFEQKIIYIPNRIFVDEDTRVLLLKEAANFTAFKNLNIEKEFFAFLKNSTFLFKFFEELAVELVDISELKKVDYYAEYIEHIDILQTLFVRYTKLLDNLNLVDKIFVPKLYKINSSYLKNIDEITLFHEGYLNNFEFKLFFEISQIVPFKIEIITNNFNKKMIEKFRYYGFDLELNYRYLLNLSQKKIEKKEKIDLQNSSYEIFSAKNRVSQIAYIKKQISKYIDLGIDAKDIAIILPDNSFVELLELFDEENNFNFAMGFSYTKTKTYQKLLALYEYFIDPNVKNRYRIQNFGFDIKKLNNNISSWKNNLSSKQMSEIFEQFIDLKNNTQEINIYKEELFLFSKLFDMLQNYPFHKVLYLFLNRLKSRTIDDVRGGKITVLEILETRGVKFKALIVVDFNEDKIPFRSQKDLFLSSEIRFLANLPTSKDRENLQKYYYKMAFDRAKYVSISYVEDEINQPSRFLDELNINHFENISNELELNHILFKPYKQKEHFVQDDLILKYDFTKVKLSATKLKTYLDCKRKYFFKYIQNIKDVDVPTDKVDEKEMGNILHDSLKKLYSQKKVYFDKDELLFDLQKILYQNMNKDFIKKFYIDLWIEKLKNFALHEVQRFENGYKVLLTEIEKKITYQGFKFIGYIDRVDIKDNKLYVLDYKTGTIAQTTKKQLNKTTDFQLQFYYLLMSKDGDIGDVGFYDLNSARIVHDNFFEEKLNLLDEHLKSLSNIEQNFNLTETIKNCQYCPYKKICNRG